MLMHNIHSSTVEAIPAILKELSTIGKLGQCLIEDFDVVECRLSR